MRNAKNIFGAGHRKIIDQFRIPTISGFSIILLSISPLFIQLFIQYKTLGNISTSEAIKLRTILEDIDHDSSSHHYGNRWQSYLESDIFSQKTTPHLNELNQLSTNCSSKLDDKEIKYLKILNPSLICIAKWHISEWKFLFIDSASLSHPNTHHNSLLTFIDAGADALNQKSPWLFDNQSIDLPSGWSGNGQKLSIKVELLSLSWSSLLFLQLVISGLTIFALFRLQYLSSRSRKKQIHSTFQKYNLIKSTASLGMPNHDLKAPSHSPLTSDKASSESAPTLISRQKSLIQQLRLSSMVVQHSPEWIAVADANGRLIEVNPALRGMLGFSKNDLMDMSMDNVLFKDQSHEVVSEVQLALANDSQWRGTLKYVDTKGIFVEALTSVRNIPEENGQAGGIVAIMSDITELRSVQKELERLATTDSLTGLPNARKFESQLEEVLNFSKVNGQKVAVFFMDVDHFKSINDTLGHAAGDVVLQKVPHQILEWLGPSTVVCRRSGDEFIAYQVVSDDSYVFCNAMAKVHPHTTIHLPQPFDLKLTVRFSIGMAISPDAGSDCASLFQAADSALYIAKERGRGCLQVYSSEIGNKVMRRSLLERSMEHAIKSKQFSLVYQPQIDLRTGRVFALEALSRWQHPEIGIISPEEFIPIAEESGHIIPLGRWVLSQAIKDIEKFLKIQPDLVVSVNFSLREISRPDFFDWVESVIDPNITNLVRHLELEITESAFQQISTEIIEKLTILRKRGWRISIDDFGTGQSSLARLSLLPVNKIKLDRFFASNLKRSDIIEIIKLVVSLSNKLDKELVIEGTEIIEDCHMLMEFGCYRFQGYATARPNTLNHWSNHGFNFQNLKPNHWNLNTF